MATVTTTKDQRKDKDGGIFSRFFAGLVGCLDKGPCHWLYNPQLGGYYPDPDHPNNCGGTCHCDPPVALTYQLRKRLKLNPNSFPTDCLGPGQMGPTEQQIQVLIDLLDKIFWLKRIVLGLAVLSLGLAGASIYLWNR